VITAIENYAHGQNFVERIFDTKDEADEYMKMHPNKDSCKIKELDGFVYPFAIIEISGGVVQFNYLKNEEELVKFIKALDIAALLRKQRLWLEKTGLIDSADESDLSNICTLNVIHHNEINEYIDRDGMGAFDHYHIHASEFERVKKTGKYKIIEETHKEILKWKRTRTFWIKTMPIRKRIKKLPFGWILTQVFSCTRYAECRESECDECMKRYL
jgi:hypothetical protein